mmetsp:Transcript_116049/g.370270  ORF Transcript_116049/g.370270 Transcript_116049/m.370270 type:complete len:311 (+) Transcript_116049:365-1297(+)
MPSAKPSLVAFSDMPRPSCALTLISKAPPPSDAVEAATSEVEESSTAAPVMLLPLLLTVPLRTSLPALSFRSCCQSFRSFSVSALSEARAAWASLAVLAFRRFLRCALSIPATREMSALALRPAAAWVRRTAFRCSSKESMSSCTSEAYSTKPFEREAVPPQRTPARRPRAAEAPMPAGDVGVPGCRAWQASSIAATSASGLPGPEQWQRSDTISNHHRENSSKSRGPDRLRSKYVATSFDLSKTSPRASTSTRCDSTNSSMSTTWLPFLSKRANRRCKAEPTSPASGVPVESLLERLGWRDRLPDTGLA